MIFNVRKTDGSPLVNLDPGTANNSRSSLILFGKNFANWGTALNENMVHLMEHFADQTPPPNPLTGQLWYDTINKVMKVYQDGVWNLLNAASLQGIVEDLVPNRLYVSKSGSDSNSGRSWFTAKLTIRAACEAAAEQIARGDMTVDHVSILVASGDYTEITPIIVPAGVSIIGDNLRSVTVRPREDLVTQNVFLLSSKTYVYGITVRDHRLDPSALDITPTDDPRFTANASGRNLPRDTVQTGWAFSFAPGVVIRVSPYIQNCSSISGDPGTGSGIYPGGGGVLVDSNTIDPDSRIHSIVVDAFTQINLGGIGVKVVNKGYMQLVSFFVNFCQFGLLCVNGGHVTALNSNCSFGNYSLWSEGFRYLETDPDTHAVNQTWTGDGINRVFTTTSGKKIYPDQLRDLEVLVNNVAQTVNVDYTVSDGSGIQSVITFITAPALNATITARIRFGSLIEASGYTMSYTGAGLDYSRLSAGQGGVGRSDPNKYTIAYPETPNDPDDPIRSYARVYHTTTDESGDFYVGLVTPSTTFVDGVQQSARPSFRINQQRGAIDGRAFYQSIFGFMAPFILVLSRRGK
jgi:hypothetical protein